MGTMEEMPNSCDDMNDSKMLRFFIQIDPGYFGWFFFLLVLVEKQLKHQIIDTIGSGHSLNISQIGFIVAYVCVCGVIDFSSLIVLEMHVKTINTFQ